MFRSGLICNPLHPALASCFPQGMVLSAEYIKKKLEQEMVLSQAFGRDLVSIRFLLLLQVIQKMRFP